MKGLPLALAALLTAGTAAAVALVRALHVTAPQVVAAERIVIPQATFSSRGAGTSLETALKDDPFSAQRAPAPGRYRLTRVVPPASAATSKSPAVQARPVVMGTVIGTKGTSFATITIGKGVPKIVSVGDTVGEYTVDTIEQGRVVLMAPSGQRIDVRTKTD